MQQAPRILLPAPLPRRAKLLGGLALAAFLVAFGALLRDAWLGNALGTAVGFSVGIGLSLLWVLADAPLRYELTDDALVVVTRLRRVRRSRLPLRFVGALGRDRFAINGGFGWYGWFRGEGGTVRAWVTDPACVWVMEGAHPTAISPVEGAMCSGLSAGAPGDLGTSRAAGAPSPD